MKKRRIYALVAGLVAVAAVALLLIQVVIPGMAGTGSPEASPPEMVRAPIAASPAVAPAVEETTTAPTASVAEETAAAPGGPQEGIKVHGHWTVEVRNPDGSLVERREFDNALYDDLGQRTISRILTREKCAGQWSISLWSLNTSNSPCWAGAGRHACKLLEIDYPGYTTPTWQFKTLQVSVPTTGENSGKIVLSGSMVAYADGDIGLVRTNIGLCTSDIAPDDCTIEGTATLTETELPGPITVLNGQQILVEVVIGFS